MSEDDIECSLQDLLVRVKSYHPSADEDLIQRAYRFAEKVHQGQVRRSGEPYIAHPLAAAHLLAELEMDEVAIAACLLHDTIEDCAMSEQKRLQDLQVELEEARRERQWDQEAELRQKIATLQQEIETSKARMAQELMAQFGLQIRDLVEGVTRLSEIHFRRGEEEADSESWQHERIGQRIQAETIRKMCVATAKDLRVLIIKLADRLHNMRTLDALPPAKRRRSAHETELIYARLAHRLGIWRLKWELEDLSLKYLQPEVYESLRRRVAQTHEERMEEVERAVQRVREAMADAGIECEVSGRPKHLYSIYHKMLSQGIDFEDIYDLVAIRVIVNTINECYEALGIIHSLWNHLPEHFADYISWPKPNGYKSIHTKVQVPNRGPMEVQIRTWAMHKEAEQGVAAHWRYKADGKIDPGFADRLSSLWQLLNSANNSPDEFWAALGEDQWDREVYVLTPMGDVVDLPQGATPVDFAYRIHTEVGHSCVGAKVNRRMVPLDTVLRSGDIVEIICQKNKGPSRDWLQFVRTAEARSRIKSYLKKQHWEEHLQAGRQAVEREAQRLRIDLEDLYKEDQELHLEHFKGDPHFEYEEVLLRVARRLSFATEDNLLAAIGYGEVSAENVVNRIRQEVEATRQRFGKPVPLASPPVETAPLAPRRMKVSVSAGDVGDVYFRRSKCCLPMPGDAIIGYITRGKGITIHRSNCRNLVHHRRQEPGRVVELEWTPRGDLLYDVPLTIRANDRLGLLSEITTIISNNGINMTSAQGSISPRQHIATFHFVLEFLDSQEMEKLVKELSRFPPVISVDVRGQRVYPADAAPPPDRVEQPE